MNKRDGPIVPQNERNFNRFSAWLGKNSSANKNGRILSELQTHMLVSGNCSASRSAKPLFFLFFLLLVYYFYFLFLFLPSFLHHFFTSARRCLLTCVQNLSVAFRTVLLDCHDAASPLQRDGYEWQGGSALPAP